MATEPRRLEAAVEPPARTDVLLAAIGREVQRHRAAIDADPDLRTVTIMVRWNRQTGLPRTVVVTQESEREYPSNA